MHVNWIVLRNVFAYFGVALLFAGIFAESHELLIFGVALLANSESWMRDKANEQQRVREWRAGPWL